ncbi:MAG TPA: cytochrome P450 [Terriglobia bacterium]|nr:cytochrome P450 [Terriglobia bacterium]
MNSFLEKTRSSKGSPGYHPPVSAATRGVLPPGPKGSLIKGNLTSFQRDPLGFMTKCAREYGDVAAFRFVNVRGCFLSHPDHVESVLATNYRQFKKGRALQMTRRIFGNGLLTSEGDFWLRQRRLAQPAFHKGRIEAYGQVITDYTNQMLGGWRDGQRVDLHDAMMRLTLRIVGKTLFDAEVAEESNAVNEAVSVFMDQFVGLRSLARRLVPQSIPTPGNRRYWRAVKNLNKIIYGIIARRRESGKDSGDLLSMLLAARDEDGSRMTDEQLRDEVLTLFLAGHETTAVALTWTLYLLSLHPESEARLLDELDNAFEGRPPEVQDMPRLSYTERVVKESMRLYPPAYVLGREALTNFKIGGFDIPARTQVLMSPWVIQRDPRFYADPERFNPDRWTDDFVRQLPRFAYFPFGGGPRQCIGNSFAMMEVELVLATIAQRFRLQFPAGEKMTPSPTFTLRPNTKARFHAVERPRLPQWPSGSVCSSGGPAPEG